MINSFEGDYRWLSNFWPIEVYLDDIKYSSVEHAYQAAKSRDVEIRENIRILKTSGEAKRAGKKISIREDWDEVRDMIMLNLLRQKFSKIPLKTQLLATKDEVLIEGNWWHDNYWGMCYCMKCKGIPFQNKLGILLMQVRQEKLDDS